MNSRDSRISPALRVAEALVRVISLIVPGHRRDAWRAEWKGELAHYWSREAPRLPGHSPTILGLISRTLVALPDAVHLAHNERSRGVLLQDLRYALRTLFRRPGFTLPVLVTLALGIGANTAIFSVVNGVILRPLPYRDADKLIQVLEIDPQGNDYSLSPPNFQSLESQARTLEGAVAYRPTSLTLTGGDVPETVEGFRVSAGFFEFLGAPPVVGRSFLPEEDLAGSDPVVILGYGAWQRRFGGSSSALGSTLVLNGVTRTIVGILPSGFRSEFRYGGSEPEVWLPQGFTERDVTLRGRHFLQVLARLQPGVELDTALEEMRTIWSGMEEAYPDTNTGWRITARPLLAEVIGGVRTPLLILLGSVGLVLLIACANVANLSLARSEKRGRELAIRSAIGGSRGRLIRQQLTEHLLLGLMGGGLGLALAYLVVARLLALFSSQLPRTGEVGIDGPVLLFTFVVSIGVGVLTGLAPMIRGGRRDLAESLREGGHRLGEGFGRLRVRGIFVVAEVALSLVLVTATGLLLNSFVRLTQVDLGFQTENLLTGDISLPGARYQSEEERALFFRQLTVDLQRHEDVLAAAAVGVLPLTGNYTHVFSMPGAREDQEWPAEDRLVTPGYFRTMEIQLRSGRDFQDTDVAGAPPVAMLNQALADQLYPGEGAVGRRVKFFGYPDEESWEIVGVVGNTRQFGVREESPPTLYRPHSQINPSSYMTVVVRASGSPLDLVATLRETVRTMDPELPFYQISTMEEIVSDSLASERILLLLLGLFGFIAIVLGAVGIFGVMSYTVSQRTGEMGVRIAVGGAPRDVLSMVVFQGMTLTGVGIALGLAGSLALGRVLTDILYGVQPSDPLTLGAVMVLVALVSLAACLVPARRAAAVDPAESLRYE